MGQDVEGMGCGERIICLCLTVCFGIAVFSTVGLWRPRWWYFHCQNRLSQWRWCSWSFRCCWYRRWRWQRPRWGSSTWRRSSTAPPQRSCRPALRRRRWCAPACTQRRWLLVEICKYVSGDCCTCGDFHISGEYHTFGNYLICRHYYLCWGQCWWRFWWRGANEVWDFVDVGDFDGDVNVVGNGDIDHDWLIIMTLK